MRTYGIVWSDANHSFGEPTPIRKSERHLYVFPDAIIQAYKKAQAILAVRQINSKYKTTIREEIPSVFVVAKIFAKTVVCAVTSSDVKGKKILES